MTQSAPLRQRGRLALFVVLLTALVIWAVTEQGVAALPLLLLYAAPHLFKAAWGYLAQRYGLPESAPDQAYLTQLRRWRRDRTFAASAEPRGRTFLPEAGHAGDRWQLIAEHAGPERSARTDWPCRLTVPR
jgi:hypothetical protein